MTHVAVDTSILGRVKQCMCCNILEVASLRNNTDTTARQSFPMNCKWSEDEH